MKKLNLFMLIPIVALMLLLPVSCSFSGVREITEVDEGGIITQADSDESVEIIVVHEESTAAADETSAAAAESNTEADKLIGNWEDLNDPSRFATIKNLNGTYSYEDNEGTYAAILKNGVLEIDVGVPGAVATAHIDDPTGCMIMKFQDTETKFKKKE